MQNYQVNLSQKDFISLIKLECEKSNPLIANMVYQVLQDESARTFVLQQSNQFVDNIARNKIKIFSLLLNSEYAYEWIHEQVNETAKRSEAPFIRWMNDTVAKMHRNSFKKKLARKEDLEDFSNLKEIISGHLVRLCEEKPDLMKIFFRTNTAVDERDATIIESWVNVFDLYPETITSGQFLDVYRYSLEKMPAFDLLDWSHRLVREIANDDDFEDHLMDHRAILAKTLLKRFHNFSQIKNMALVIPYLDDFFEDNEKALRENIGFVNVLTQKNFIEESNLLNDYDEYLTALVKLKSFKQNKMAQEEMRHLLEFFKEQKREWSSLAMKISLSMTLNEGEIEKTKVNKI